MSQQRAAAPFALPQLTSVPGVPPGTAQAHARGEVPRRVSRRVHTVTSGLGIDEAYGYLATLWLLLQRYAGYEEMSGVLLVLGLPGHARYLRSGMVDHTSSFAEVVTHVRAASAEASPALDRRAGPVPTEPASEGETVVFEWGAGSVGAEFLDAPTVVLSVELDPTGQVGVQVDSGRSASPLAGAVLSDYLSLLAAISYADGPVVQVDPFSPGSSSDSRRGVEPEGATESRRLHDVVLEHACATPDAIAVRGRDTLTYRELVRRSRRLCAVLVDHGVRVEHRVGLFLDRDEHLAVGVLGVMMSGAAFVPLAPEDPPLRRRDLARDAQVSVVVAAAGLTDDFGGDLQIVRLEDCVDGPEGEPAPSAASTAAYVLYTSGSSGKPKGVVVEHRQLMAYAEGFLDRLNSAGPLTCAMVQPLTVDSSLTCIAAAWVTGGELQVIDRATALDLPRLVAWQAGHPADVLKIAPSHLRALQASGDLAPVMPTTALVVGGEASDWRWLQQLQDEHRCAVHNHYGPTETTVGVLMLSVSEHRGRDWATAALGHALLGCEVGVLDPFGTEAPAGVRGELVVRGRLVARGYQVAPADSGFRPWRGAPAYWTGDQGIRERDGVICFAGRSDDQVKVRGFRVELGEVEQALNAHPQVAHAVALVSTDEAGRSSVGCAVQSVGAVPAEPAELVAHCRRVLPEHMVPTRWLEVSEIPRTPHGKVDRTLLRADMASRGEAAAAGRTPASPAAVRTDILDLRDVVTSTWQDVLGAGAVGQDVNFFDAGGHSLLLLDLQRALAARTGRQVELLDLFQHTTIAAQTELLRSGSEVRQPADDSGRRKRQEALARRRNQQLRRGGRDAG